MDKPYALFISDWYYPSGGWMDFNSAHATLNEAIEAARVETEGRNSMTMNVTDMRSLEIAWSGGRTGNEKGEFFDDKEFEP